MISSADWALAPGEAMLRGKAIDDERRRLSKRHEARDTT